MFTFVTLIEGNHNLCGNSYVKRVCDGRILVVSCGDSGCMLLDVASILKEEFETVRGPFDKNHSFRCVSECTDGSCSFFALPTNSRSIIKCFVALDGLKIVQVERMTLETPPDVERVLRFIVEETYALFLLEESLHIVNVDGCGTTTTKVEPQTHALMISEFVRFCGAWALFSFSCTCATVFLVDEHLKVTTINQQLGTDSNCSISSVVMICMTEERAKFGVLFSNGKFSFVVAASQTRKKSRGCTFFIERTVDLCLSEEKRIDGTLLEYSLVTSNHSKVIVGEFSFTTDQKADKELSGMILFDLELQECKRIACSVPKETSIKTLDLFLGEEQDSSFFSAAWGTNNALYSCNYSFKGLPTRPLANILSRKRHWRTFFEPLKETAVCDQWVRYLANQLALDTLDKFTSVVGGFFANNLTGIALMPKRKEVDCISKEYNCIKCFEKLCRTVVPSASLCIVEDFLSYMTVEVARMVATLSSGNDQLNNFPGIWCAYLRWFIRGGMVPHDAQLQVVQLLANCATPKPFNILEVILELLIINSFIPESVLLQILIDTLEAYGSPDCTDLAVRVCFSVMTYSIDRTKLRQCLAECNGLPSLKRVSSCILHILKSFKLMFERFYLNRFVQRTIILADVHNSCTPCSHLLSRKKSTKDAKINFLEWCSELLGALFQEASTSNSDCNDELVILEKVITQEINLFSHLRNLWPYIHRVKHLKRIKGNSAKKQESNNEARQLNHQEPYSVYYGDF